MTRTRVRALLSGLVALAAVLAATLIPAGPATAAASYSASLGAAIDHLDVATERRDGYERDEFVHWVDADDDACDARDEVLIAEADDAPSVGSGCTLSGGRWYSYYDGVSHTRPSDLDVDHLVPLAEAWDSGAYRWTAARRQSYANDLGDRRTLVGVTDSVNQAKGDQDVAEWLPERQRCRYLREFVAVKVRWSLAVDRTEKAAMKELAGDCDDTTITVVVV